MPYGDVVCSYSSFRDRLFGCAPSVVSAVFFTHLHSSPSKPKCTFPLSSSFSVHDIISSDAYWQETRRPGDALHERHMSHRRLELRHYPTKIRVFAETLPQFFPPFFFSPSAGFPRPFFAAMSVGLSKTAWDHYRCCYDDACGGFPLQVMDKVPSYTFAPYKAAPSHCMGGRGPQRCLNSRSVVCVRCLANGPFLRARQCNFLVWFNAQPVRPGAILSSSPLKLCSSFFLPSPLRSSSLGDTLPRSITSQSSRHYTHRECELAATDMFFLAALLCAFVLPTVFC